MTDKQPCFLCEHIAKLRAISQQLEALPEIGDYFDEPIGEALDAIGQAVSNATHYIGNDCDMTHPENFCEREWNDGEGKYVLPEGLP